MTQTFEASLQAIRQRLEAATPSKWKVVPSDYVGYLGQQFFNVVGGIPDEDGDLTCVCPGRVVLENAQFIAHSRTDIARLLAVIEMAIAQRDAAIKDCMYELPELEAAERAVQIIETRNYQIARILESGE